MNLTVYHGPQDDPFLNGSSSPVFFTEKEQETEVPRICSVCSVACSLKEN